MPYAGPPSQNDGSQALLLSPTPAPESALAVTTSAANDTQALFWMLLLGVMAIPGMIIMTLIATVLIRR